MKGDTSDLLIKLAQGMEIGREPIQGSGHGPEQGVWYSASVEPPKINLVSYPVVGEVVGNTHPLLKYREVVKWTKGWCLTDGTSVEVLRWTPMPIPPA